MLASLHKRYTAGETSADALRYAEHLTRNGFKPIISSLGERSPSPEHAQRKAQSYRDLLYQLEGSPGTVSVKPSDIGIFLSADMATENMVRILMAAKATGKLLEIDMEFRSMLDPITDLCTVLQTEGHSFRVACQSGLIDAIPRAEDFYEKAKQTRTQLSLRIVTGSCYSKSGNGYEPTLETSFRETDQSFFRMIDLSLRERQEGALMSAVGTGSIERVTYAAQQGLEIQFLKGEEDTPAYLTGLKLMEQGADMSVYTTFGALNDPGVQGYLLRRA